MILGECGAWAIEWGPGSPRPDHFMLYRNGHEDEYLGTYLTLWAAIREARLWEGRPHSCVRSECLQ